MEEKETKPDFEGFTEEIDSIKGRLAPYQRPILIIGITLFLIIIFFVGFGIGGFVVCHQQEGLLDDSFKCHPDYYNRNNTPQAFIPDIQFQIA